MNQRTGIIYVGEVGGLPTGEIKCTDDILTATKLNKTYNSTIVFTYKDLGYTPCVSEIIWHMQYGVAPQIRVNTISSTKSEIYLDNVFNHECIGQLEIIFIQSNIEMNTMIESYDMPVMTISMLE